MILELSYQVPPLALCQRLKALGMPQETTFQWYEGVDDTLFVSTEREHFGKFPLLCAAPTVAELGVLLPHPRDVPHKFGDAPHWEQTMWRDGNGEWWHDNEPGCGEGVCCGHATEAEARALLLIALVERGIVSWEQAK